MLLFAYHSGMSEEQYDWGIVKEEENSYSQVLLGQGGATH